MYEYRAKFKRAINGNTLDLLIDLGFKVFIEQRVHLKGLRALESAGDKKSGLEVLGYIEKRIAENQNEFIIRTEQDPENFGRFQAEILLGDTDSSLNDELIAKGIVRLN